MILGSFAEILSLGAIIPFLAILTDPMQVFSHSSILPIIQVMGLTDSKQLLLLLTVIFCLAVLIAAAMRLLLLWVSTRLSFSTGSDLSINIYRRTLYQPYSVHIARNSSEVIDGMSNKTNNTVYLINMTLNLISSSIMMVAILIALISVDPLIALTTFGGFGLIYSIIIKLTRSRLLVNSQTVARESTRVIKSLQEGLGGIREILLNGSQATFCQIYQNADQQLRLAQGNNIFISSSPRNVMEALGMLLIIIVAFALSLQEEGINKAIPTLGALALGAQRLLPLFQQAYSSYSSIKGGQVSLQDTIDLLEQRMPDHTKVPTKEILPFKNQISLKKISFRYDLTETLVLKNLNLIIKKGSRVGFVGATGSGKSTLIDLVMGLLLPTQGAIEVDGKEVTLRNQRSWQVHIAHVSQFIFLADSTICENIAFGVPKGEIDIAHVRQAAKRAQISDLIESWPTQYQTLVGERGIRLSGGQRQRIGIARALYNKVDVIVFDEATSALDNETEQAVMEAIEGLSKDITLLMIAHRLTSLKFCTEIFELGGANIKCIGSYQDMMTGAKL
jgi:ATP-binding cassette subfamily B protein